MGIIKIAEVCHEILRAYSECIGETLLPAWIDAPKWQRESAIVGVRMLQRYHETTPEEAHESWMKQKLATGWTYGETKSELHKTHPSLVPYYALSTAERAKDFIFLAVAKELLKLAPIETDYQKQVRRKANLIAFAWWTAAHPNGTAKDAWDACTAFLEGNQDGQN